jgi:hypothetical protein
VCKSTIALDCLYLNVIKRKCVIEVLTKPIIRTTTRHFVMGTILQETIQLWSYYLYNIHDRREEAMAGDNTTKQFVP